MNFTILAPVCKYPCMDTEQCIVHIKEYVTLEYEFVWLFIAGILFNELASIILGLKIDANIKYKIITGLKISYYLCNLSGIIWFLTLI